MSPVPQSSSAAASRAAAKQLTRQLRQLLAVTIAQRLTQPVGKAGLHTSDTRGERLTGGIVVANAARQPQERFFGENGLVQCLELNGSSEAQVAFLGKPDQGPKTALMSLAWQAEFIGLFVPDEIFNIQRDLPWEGLVEQYQAASGVAVEVVNLQVHGSWLLAIGYWL